MGLAVGIYGVPGVGKSTLTRRLVSVRRDLRQILGSAVVREVIAPASFDDLDRWSPARREAVRDAAIERLEVERRAFDGLLLVDGHFSLRNRRTGVLESVIGDTDRNFYDAWVLIDSTPEQVVAQRVGDGDRCRGDDVDEVHEHLLLERSLAEATHRLTGRPVHVVSAPSVDARADDVLRFLDSLRGGA